MLYSAVQQIIQVLFEFPNTDGTAGQVLQTDGYANLSFGTVGGGGKVLQVIQVVKTDDFSSSIATDTAVDITGLSASITPSSTSNKILISYHIHINSSSQGGKIQLLRDSTKICINTSVSGFEAQTSIMHNSTVFSQTVNSFSFLDSPSSTSSITYKPQLSHSSGVTQTLYVNRPSETNARHGRVTSQITLMEIAG